MFLGYRPRFLLASTYAASVIASTVVNDTGLGILSVLFRVRGMSLRGMSPDREEHTMLSPDAIAETYWQLHSQDRTAWNLEVDLRPSVESF